MNAGSNSSFHPFFAWQRMDNYLSHFLYEHPFLDSELKSRIRHFQYQYLLKVSNICPQDALYFQQNVSPWSSPCRGDYHRFYHLNPLLGAVENALGVSKEGFDPFLLSDRRSFESHLLAASSWNSEIGSLFQECSFVSVQDQDALLAPKTMREEIRAFIVENGFTPTIQQAAGAAASFSLTQENLTHEFPKQKEKEPSFASFLLNPIYRRFQELGSKVFSAGALAALFERCQALELDEYFRQKGIFSLLADSYGRVLSFLEEALSIDLSQYFNWLQFEALLDLAHEEILLWLIIKQPYSEKDLQNAIESTIQKPAFLKTTSSGMAAFSEVLRAILKPRMTILLFDGCYFENRASLLKTYPSSSFYLVRFPDYDASFQANLDLLKEQNKTIDLVFINFHENILRGRYRSRENKVADILASIIQEERASSSLTVIIDHTIGFLNSSEVKELFSRFCKEIEAKRLHFVILWSHQKFDLLGFDKISAGSYAVYSQNDFLIEQFQKNPSSGIDFVSKQCLTHYFAAAPQKLEERRARIFSNALYLNSRIAKSLKYQGKNSDQPVLVVLKEDGQNFSIDVQCAHDLEQLVSNAFAKRKIPLLLRSGFGFNLTSIASTRFHTLRFSIGLEERHFLDEFLEAFHDIFLKRQSLN